MKTRIIGLVIDGVEFEEPWGLPTYHGLRHGADVHDYDLLTIRRPKPGASSQVEEMRFLDRRCDAYIFVVPLDRYRLMESLQRHGIPAVSCYTDDVPPTVATIVVANEDAMRQAVRHLVQQGHRQIGYLGISPETRPFERRLSGFIQEVAEAGIEHSSQIITEINGDYRAAAEQVIQLARKGTITAVVCALDRLALAVIEAAERFNLTLPLDLSITGVGDAPEAQWRGLTSIQCSFEEVGRNAISALIELMNGSDATACSRVLPVNLVSRRSVANLKTQE